MIALILARGGSKGIPDKNIKVLNEKPLLAYPILAAKSSQLIEEVFVSTDSIKIAEVAIKYGARVIIRPSEISKDNSLDIEAFRHFCAKTKHSLPIVHLRATTPILNSKTIDEAIQYFISNIDKCDSLRSGHKTSESVYKYFIKEENYWKPIVDKYDSNSPRQTLPETFVPNGYIDIVKPKVFINSDKFHGERILSFITEHSPEVDSMDDFYYIEYLINKKNV